MKKSMNDTFIKLSVYLLASVQSLVAQEPIELISVAFWNVENLFDTVNDSLVIDDERTPKGTYLWTEKRFKKKLLNLASVIERMDELQNKVPDILGLCEVENLEVVQGLLQTIKNSPYQIIHKDSPDRRGIDVCMLYNSEKVYIQNYHYRSLKLYDEEQRRIYTRDQLVVEALISGSKLYFIINHWPSRSGGEQKSKPFRIKAAELNLKLIDSIRRNDPNAALIGMGDFNDNPDSDSFKRTLKTSDSKYLTSKTKLYNPMGALYKKGVGSLAYRGQWNLFDQFYVTDNLNWNYPIQYYKAVVYKPKRMVTKSGNYRGYPKRSYTGTTYLGGYSDHFPIVMYLYKKREPK